MTARTAGLLAGGLAMAAWAASATTIELPQGAFEPGSKSIDFVVGATSTFPT